jgi:hypothetical protein
MVPRLAFSEALRRLVIGVAGDPLKVVRRSLCGAFGGTAVLAARGSTRTDRADEAGRSFAAGPNVRDNAPGAVLPLRMAEYL